MEDKRILAEYKGVEYEMFQRTSKIPLTCECCDKKIKKGDFYTNSYEGPGPCCEDCFSS